MSKKVQISGKSVPIKLKAKKINAKGVEVAFASLIGKKIGMEVFLIDADRKRIATLGYGSTRIGTSLFIEKMNIEAEISVIDDPKIIRELDRVDNKLIRKL